MHKEYIDGRISPGVSSIGDDENHDNFHMMRRMRADGTTEIITERNIFETEYRNGAPKEVGKPWLKFIQFGRKAAGGKRPKRKVKSHIHTNVVSLKIVPKKSVYQRKEE